MTSSHHQPMDKLNNTSSSSEPMMRGRSYVRRRYGEYEADSEPLSVWAMIIIIVIMGFAVIWPICWMCRIILTDHRSKIIGLRQSSEFECIQSRFIDEMASEAKHRHRRKRLRTINESGKLEEVKVDLSPNESFNGSTLNKINVQGMAINQERVEIIDLNGNGSEILGPAKMIVQVEIHSV